MKKLTLGAIMTVSLVLFGAGAAGATADEHASCPGLALSEHGPAGEARGEIMAGKAGAESLGVPFGGLVGQFAQFHLGTHAACEEVA